MTEDFKAGQNHAADLIMKALDRTEWDLESATSQLNLALTGVVVRAFGDDKGSELLAAIRAKCSPVIMEIAAERGRQIGKGYDGAHDDQHRTYELSTVAAAVALGASDQVVGDVPDWAEHIIEKWDTRRRLVIAGALLVAEIERFDRNQASRSS